MQTESKEKSVWNPFCPVKVQSKRKSKDKSKRKKIKKQIREKTPCASVQSVSVFWFKLCSRRLTERHAAILSSYNIYYPNTTLKEPAFNCSFVHKVEYWSTPIEVLQYSYWSTPVLLIGLLQYSLLDYSSTPIGLLQYFYWITPVLLSLSLKVLHKNHKDSSVWLPSYSIYCRTDEQTKRFVFSLCPYNIYLPDTPPYMTLTVTIQR